MELDYDIESGDKLITVTFEAFPRLESDGIGGYEFWGMRGYDEGKKYVSLEHFGNPKYKMEDYTPEENSEIKKFMNDEKQFKKLEELFCKMYY